MRVLVTGASGFLGENLSLGLLAKAHQVFAISRNKLNFEHENLIEILCDISNIEQLKTIDDIDVVFHCAANINYSADIQPFSAMMQDNVYSMIPMIKYMSKNGIKHLVYSSSSSVYKKNFKKNCLITERFPIEPKNNYAITKLSSEYLLQNLCNDYGINLVILRYSSIYGPLQKENSILPIFLQSAIANKDIKILGNGERTQDYVYVGDVVDVNIKILENNFFEPSIYNIGSGELVTDLCLAEVIKKVTLSKSKIIVANKVKQQIEYFTYDINHAKAKLGFCSTKLAEGLSIYYSHLNSR